MRSKIDTYIGKRFSEGKSTFVLCGGRRSGKTYSILKFLMLYCRINPNTIVNVASMTSEQGRLGAYADAKNIVSLASEIYKEVEIFSSPREIRFRNGSRVHFNQYSNSETAKGIACDWLFLNEANNFSKQQYIDLKANVRKGTFIDYNPNIRFWVDDFFEEKDICKSTWKDNPYLTKAQIDYFEELKRLGDKPDANPVDRRNYNIYYLGIYDEIKGNIFNQDNITICDFSPKLKNYNVFCDPSALRGNDYFACVLSAVGEDGKVYIVDTFSINEGSRDVVFDKLKEWNCAFDIKGIYIETNGIIGIDFYEYCQNKNLAVFSWNSRGNKFNRIVANYQNIKEKLVFLKKENLGAFLDQVYDFSEKCEHDDNIDAVNSSYNLQKMLNT